MKRSYQFTVTLSSKYEIDSHEEDELIDKLYEKDSVLLCFIDHGIQKVDCEYEAESIEEAKSMAFEDFKEFGIESIEEEFFG